MNDAAQVTEPPVEISAELIRRFWRRVQSGDDSECWLWKGPFDRLGYGQFTLSGRPRRAHRVAYYLWNGDWFGPDTKVRHSCDVRECCNPNHLIPGTQAQNMRDRRLREGYRTIARGAAHGLAKLTEGAVRDIRRAEAGRGVGKALADLHGVTEAQISRIRTGRAWRSLG